ncbi:hypothetical protein FDI24_gp118 [Acidovorax phage ACP17]|uniref:Uncharacterized protein n=1 Tax=Acidovorax phage ACP17 TaxID=2010329 RepID=A0A218M2W4_9CAUD|nr:hypothetical protein FDI24_gp118 [Acidovorax phage ACP17]ASD50398.1 hypothetical protein [Acidovorax phage ACP17]
MQYEILEFEENTADKSFSASVESGGFVYCFNDLHIDGPNAEGRVDLSYDLVVAVLHTADNGFDWLTPEQWQHPHDIIAGDLLDDILGEKGEALE